MKVVREILVRAGRAGAVRRGNENQQSLRYDRIKRSQGIRKVKYSYKKWLNLKFVTPIQ